MTQGDNLVPVDADPLRDRLAEQYKKLIDRTEEITGGASRIPAELDDTTIDRVTGFAKQIKAAAADAEDARKAEKADFLEAGRKVDAFFKALIERLQEASAEVEKRIAAYLESAGEKRVRGALGGTASLVGRIEFEITDRSLAVQSLADYFDDEAIAKAARWYLRAKKSEVDECLKAKTQPLHGIRFLETHKARVS
jgi:hypothetical protein